MKIYQVYKSTYRGEFLVGSFFNKEDAEKLLKVLKETFKAQKDFCYLRSAIVKDSFLQEDYFFLKTRQ
jgi:hypothetical protein